MGKGKRMRKHIEKVDLSLKFFLKIFFYFIITPYKLNEIA